MKKDRTWGKGLFLFAVACVALLVLAPGVGATPASSTRIVAVNWAEMEKEAKKLFTPDDVSALEKIVKMGDEPVAGASDKIKPPFIPIKSHAFQRVFVDFLKKVLERKEADKVERFARAITRKKLLRGYARWFPYRGRGYMGPLDVGVTLSLSPEKEYLIAIGFKATGPGAKDVKHKEQTHNYQTKIYKP